MQESASGGTQWPPLSLGIAEEVVCQEEVLFRSRRGLQNKAEPDSGGWDGLVAQDSQGSGRKGLYCSRKHDGRRQALEAVGAGQAPLSSIAQQGARGLGV